MAEINPTAAHGLNLHSPVSPMASAADSDFTANFWGDDGFSFNDFLDLINPLQHLPIVGTLYRAATGDEISTGSSILGGGLFGGILGAGAAVVNTIIEETTGGKIFEHVTSLFDDEAAPEQTVVASIETPSDNSAAFGRGAQEATWSTPHNPSVPPAPTVVARNYATGRSAQEATMTSVASASIAPAAPAQTAQADVAPVAELAAPIAENPNPAWLAATPRVQPELYNAASKPYVTPEMGLQLIQALAGNTDYKPMTSVRDTIGRYSHQALVSKIMTERPATLDNLY